MNASTSSGLVVEPLLFSWEPPRRRRAAITAFVALSLIAHALCFYLFQILYPQTASAINPRETSASFSKELDAFGAPILPNRSFTASNDEAPEAIRFRVAVSGSGEIRYCFPLNSSGDPALDEQARRYLALCRFSQSSISGAEVDRSPTWGIETAGWGNAVRGPRHMPTSTPTP